MVEIEVKNINDKARVKQWLEIAACNINDNDDILEVIHRLEREIEYDNNWKSDEYKEIKAKEEEPIFDKGLLEECADNYIKELESRKEKAKELLSKDHSKAIEWMVKTGGYLDDEALAYGDNSKYGNIKQELIDLQDMFIKYIHEVAKDLGKHVLYNDRVDEWYYQKKDTDKRYERPEYFFPSEVFVLKYKDLYWYYSETNGQGTAFGLCILDNDGIEGLCKDYGLSKERLKGKVYYI